MMEGWKEYKLGEIVDLKQGFALNKKSNHYLAKDNIGLPLLKISDLKNGTETLFVKENIPKQFIVTPSEIIYSRTGQVGLAFMGKTGVVYNNCFKVIPKEMVYSVFLYQWLNTSFVRTTISSLATGSAQPDLNHGAFKCVKINLPPLKTQRKIASILSGYDDLIENNLKRIKLLEEQAQQTYEEWFVRFKFPGHENVKFDEVSGLPVGWEKKKIGDICKISGGGTPSKAIDEYWINGDITWFSPTDLSKSKSLIQLDSSSKITLLGLKKSSAKLLQSNSFMMTSRATIGLFGILDKPFCTNQGFINITPKSEIDKEYLIYNFKTNIPLFLNYATGATFLEISKSVFNKIKIIWPTIEILQNFHNLISLIHNEMLNLTKQNQHLKEARDILLPRLMSGMIDVDSLEVDEQLGMVAEKKAKYNKV